MARVAIAGAGPVGLMTARELQLQGVPTLIFEAAMERSPHSKALGIHSRTIEILKMRGLADVMLKDSIIMPSHHFAMLENSIDYTTLPSPFPFLLAYPQVRTEQILETAALDAGTELRRGHRVVDVSQSSQSVVIEVEGQQGRYTETVDYLVGCDGGRSIVRDSVGIDFPGSEVSAWWFLGEVHLDDPPERGFARHGKEGAVFAAPIPGGLYRVSGVDVANAGLPTRPLQFDEFRESVIRTAGSDFGMRDPIWLTRFGDACRLASNYRRRRVMVAGDAAHIHIPAGGVGLNVGLQDAVNLGWRLGLVALGKADESLLDGYHNDRHPVGEALMTNCEFQGALMRTFPPAQQALRTLMNELIGNVPELTHELAMRLSGQGVRYARPDDGHAVVGTRAPELKLSDPAGSTLFDQFSKPRFVFLCAENLKRVEVEHALSVTANTSALSTAGWADVTAALIRPDGYVLWATEDTDPTAIGAAANAALAAMLRGEASELSGIGSTDATVAR